MQGEGSKDEVVVQSIFHGPHFVPSNNNHNHDKPEESRSTLLCRALQGLVEGVERVQLRASSSSSNSTQLVVDHVPTLCSATVLVEHLTTLLVVANHSSNNSNNQENNLLDRVTGRRTVVHVERDGGATGSLEGPSSGETRSVVPCSMWTTTRTDQPVATTTNGNHYQQTRQEIMKEEVEPPTTTTFAGKSRSAGLPVLCVSRDSGDDPPSLSLLTGGDSSWCPNPNNINNAAPPNHTASPPSVFFCYPCDSGGPPPPPLRFFNGRRRATRKNSIQPVHQQPNSGDDPPSLSLLTGGDSSWCPNPNNINNAAPPNHTASPPSVFFCYPCDSGGPPPPPLRFSNGRRRATRKNSIQPVHQQPNNNNRAPLVSPALEQVCDRLRSLQGVSQVFYNATRHQLVVDHVTSLISAHDIVVESQQSNIGTARSSPNDVHQNTVATTMSSLDPSAATKTTSTFVCNQLQTDAKCLLVSTILDPLQGIDTVRCDPLTQRVTVHHLSQKISAFEIEQLLNDFELDATTLAVVHSSTALVDEKGNDYNNNNMTGMNAPSSIVTMTPTTRAVADEDGMESSAAPPSSLSSSSPQQQLQQLTSLHSTSSRDTAVQSTLICQNLYCEAECALIDELLLLRRTIDPSSLFSTEMGIQKVSYLLPLKKVVVEHVPSIVSAGKIVQILNEQSGFPLGASIDVDGGAAPSSSSFSSSSHTKDKKDTISTITVLPKCRSVLRVNHICCAAEIPAIRSILHKLPGISNHFVVVTTKLVYVEHDHGTITAQDICEALNKERFGAVIQQDGGQQQKAAMMGVATSHQTTSLFCTSSFALEARVLLHEELETALSTHFDKTQVESFSVEARTRTLYVDHNPFTLSAQTIEETLCKWPRTKLRLLVDGKKSIKIDYEAMARIPFEQEDAVRSNEHHNKYPRPTIIMSGILWCISMLSLIGGGWEHLKYIGLGSVAFGLPPIAHKAYNQLKRLRFDTNTLMLSASLGALALGEFTEAAAVMFLFALSEWLERRATSRVLQALSAIVDLKPDKANLVHHETGELIEVAASAVPTGALVAVKTGEKIPCDGVVEEGQSTVDESSLTGESRPIRKCPNAPVSGGTVNSGISQLLIRTTALAENSAVARLVRLVEEAQANRSETEKMVEEFAKIYTPLVVFAATLMCTIPWAFGSEKGREWTNIGLVFIVVGCPCALIISTPIAYVAGLAATAQKGVLVKGGAFLESLGRVKNICFDKTGTLTNGEFSLLHLQVLTHNYTRDEVIQHLTLMEERASHPVANAIMERARNENVVVPPYMVLKKHALLAGEGVRGIIDGKEVYVGNERLFERLGLLDNLPRETRNTADSWKQLGGTIGFMSIEGSGIVCAYCATDALRGESHRVVNNLKSRGVRVTMLTGDNEEAALSVGCQVGLHPVEVQARLLPKEKLDFLNAVMETEEQDSTWLGLRRKRNVVLFCGDGVNDAPALAAADVGVAMGAGAALAMETADVTLLDSNLEKLETSIQVGRLVIRIIRENLVFCVVAKFIVLGFAIAGKTHLWSAIATDVGTMVLVTLNAMTLLGTRSGSPYSNEIVGDVDKRENSLMTIGQTWTTSDNGNSQNTYQQVSTEDSPGSDSIV